jgi:hypothetical protein
VRIVKAWGLKEISFPIREFSFNKGWLTLENEIS